MQVNSRLRLLFAAFALVTSSVVMAQKTMSPADCAAMADRAARDHGTVMGGAARSGTKGAIFGAIVGGDDRGRAAGRGAALGALIGGTRGAAQKNQTYQRVYDDCMRGRYRY